MVAILETDRLYLREFIIEDASDFFNLNNDPEVVKYTGDAPFSDINAAKIFLQNYEYKIPPYTKVPTPIGRWAMIEKSDNSFIGWCGLKYFEPKDEIDIGYRLHRKFWGKNYATEAANACITFGLQKLETPLIVGRAMKENLASIRVLEKCGMTYWKDYVFHEHPGVYYRIEREA